MNTNISAEFQSKKKKHLVISIILDAIGMLSFAVPFLGEVGDSLFAPVYGILIFMMYRQKTLAGLAGGIIGFIEELLPATDILPTATIMWLYTYILQKDKTFKRFAEAKQKETKHQ